jgi:hypothetical protein
MRILLEGRDKRELKEMMKKCENFFTKALS